MIPEVKKVWVAERLPWMLKAYEEAEAIRDAISGMNEHISDRINSMIMGGSVTEAEHPSVPTLTYQSLKGLHDYYKTETLRIGDEEHEIFGYSVHQDGHMLEGCAVLIEKRPPNEWPPRTPKMLIINTTEGTAIMYDPEGEADGAHT
ncbi:MAG TPA: hypothetical protein VHU19_14335 [Pyrinomonadaceae bacterium]|jgi:hypothetical protein|nr:hypothetical protein [Pyrinomonadaceae bacterium]